MSRTNDSHEPFARNTILTDIIGDHPKALLLSALLSETGSYVSKTRLATLSGLSRTTVHTHLPDLVDQNIVTEHHQKHGYPEYRLNRDSEVAKQLGRLEWESIEAVAAE